MGRWAESWGDWKNPHFFGNKERERAVVSWETLDCSIRSETVCQIPHPHLSHIDLSPVSRLLVSFTSSFLTSSPSKNLSLPNFPGSQPATVSQHPHLFPAFLRSCVFPLGASQGGFARRGMGSPDLLILLVERNQSLYQTGSHHQLPGKLCPGCQPPPASVPPAC